MKGLFFCTLKLLPLVIVFGPGRFLVRYVVLLNASISLRVRSLFAGNRAKTPINTFWREFPTVARAFNVPICARSEVI